MPRGGGSARSGGGDGEAHVRLQDELMHLGPEGLEVRRQVGQVPQTVCLFHGAHEVVVHWTEKWAPRIDRTEGGRVYFTPVKVKLPQFEINCSPWCGVVFGWGRGCEHVD